MGHYSTDFNGQLQSKSKNITEKHDEKVIKVPYIFIGDEKRSMGEEVLKVRRILRCWRTKKPTK